MRKRIIDDIIEWILMLLWLYLFFKWLPYTSF